MIEMARVDKAELHFKCPISTAIHYLLVSAWNALFESIQVERILDVVNIDLQHDDSSTLLL